MASDYHFQTQENETVLYTVTKWKSYVKDLLRRHTISQHFLSNFKTRFNRVLFFLASLLQLECPYNDNYGLKQGNRTKNRLSLPTPRINAEYTWSSMSESTGKWCFL